MRICCIIGMAMLASLFVGMSALSAWADVYKCTDGQGKTHFQNAPCTGNAETPVVRTGPPLPPPLFVPTPLPPVVPPSPTVPCLEILSLDYKILGQRFFYTEISWKVILQNRCPKPLQPWVTFSLHDKEGFELDAHTARGFAPARDVGDVHGTFLVRTHLLQRVKTRQAVAWP